MKTGKKANKKMKPGKKQNKKKKNLNNSNKKNQMYQLPKKSQLPQASQLPQTSQFSSLSQLSQETKMYDRPLASQNSKKPQKPQKQKKQKNPTINNKKKKEKFSKKHKKLSLFIKIFIVLLLAAIVVTAGIVVGMVYGMWGQDFEINEEELIIRGNSVVYDSEGNVRAELSGDENRKIIKLEDMSKYLPKAYVAIEDERFYTHKGVDFKRTAGAIGTYILRRGSSSYGGSTITQQLVKNMTDAKERTGVEGITRKIKEWAKAYQIERMLSKDQILELYLNVIFVGDVNYGVQVGAEYYFNKDAKDLSLEECAFMAGINNAPNLYNPYGKYSYKENKEKKEKIHHRTKTVLGKMLELGYITQEEYDKSCKKIDEKGLKFKQGAKKTMIYSYHTDATISKVINDFVDTKGWTKEYATTYVYGGGLKIYSTEKPSVQEKIENIMSDHASEYTRKNGGVKSQSATVIIDNETGYVTGLVGGLGEKTESRGLNRATQSTRSTGSSIKPIAELLPGIEEGIINASTMYLDVRTEFDSPGSKKKYVPTNEGRYTGETMSVRKATGKSQNVPFVKMMAEITTPVAQDYLKKLGITTVDDDTGLSLALGGLNRGITPLEMAGAYATIANNGVYRTPLLYTKVVNSEGKTELEPKQETRTVCSKQTAYIIKDLLTSVVEAGYGTAPYCHISGIDVAAKTGTTNSQKDRWLCGFTNYYTGATWFGFDEGQKVPEGGTNPAGRIWSAVMKSLHKDKKNSRFEEPNGIVKLRVCSHTGLRASSKCKSTYYEIFKSGSEPEYCSENGSYAEICDESGKLATEYCPEVHTKYYSNALPKEKLGLWKSSVSYSKPPAERCKVHTAQGEKQNAEAPTIKILGEKTMTLKIGESYVEKGATASDAKDGDITSKVQISGSVNTSKAGTYTVKYSVKNSLEKETVATRTIIVKDESKPVPTTTPKKEENTTKPSSTNTTSDKTNTAKPSTKTNTTKESKTESKTET